MMFDRPKSLLTIAVCTYNRANNLKRLIEALHAQTCGIPFEILIINNNSSDNTQEVLERLKERSGSRLRIACENRQGIVYARNLAIEETKESEYLFFMDDDELPMPGILEAAYDALETEGAECVGGKVKNSFEHYKRPKWLGDELLGFLAEVDYGACPFWISSNQTPLWTANIAFNTKVFKDGLRFDPRYNREGRKIGGGEDAILFRKLLSNGTKIRYRPDMVVKHFPETWRIKRTYFIKLHFTAGRKFGEYETPSYPKEFFGIPPFMVVNLMGHIGKTFPKFSLQRSETIRQLMNISYSIGCIWGRFCRYTKQLKTSVMPEKEIF